MEKKIEEMARDICHLNVSCDECTMLAKQMGQSKERYCKAMQYAKRAYEKGWRKQEVVDANSATPTSEWISVEDRLPEREGKYLVYTVKGAIRFGEYRSYLVGDSKFCGPQFDYYVTHWMPLPDPPKGGE